MDVSDSLKYSERNSSLKAVSSDTVQSKPSSPNSANDKGWKENIRLYIKNYCDVSSFHGFRYFSESNRPFFERDYITKMLTKILSGCIRRIDEKNIEAAHMKLGCSCNQLGLSFRNMRAADEGKKFNFLKERFMWFSVVLLVISGMFFPILSQTNTYLSRPTVMLYNGSKTPVGDIPFPAITFCSDNQLPVSIYNITKLKEISKRRNFTANELLKLMGGTLLCNDSNSESFLKQNFEAISDKKSLIEIQKGGFMMYLQKCHSFTKSIKWRTKILEPGCHYMQYTTHNQKQCLSFNMLPPFGFFTKKFILEFFAARSVALIKLYPYKYSTKLSSWSPDSGFKNKSEEILLRLHGNSLIDSADFLLDFLGDEVQMDCKPRSYGFTVIVHNPAEYPYVTHASAYAEVDKRTILRITPKIIQTDDNLRDWKPEERGCYFSHERPLLFYGIYSSLNCERECEANLTLQQCGCNAISQPHMSSSPFCGPDKLECALNSMLKSESVGSRRKALFSTCNCLPACNEITYSLETIVQPRNWTFNSVDYNIPQDKFKRNSYVNVLAYYRSRSVTAILRVGRMSLSDFIAHVGGLMSLFLGFTFLCIFELFYYGFMRWINSLQGFNYKCFKNVVPTSNKSTYEADKREYNDSSDNIQLPFNL